MEFPTLKEFKKTVIHPRDLQRPGKIICDPENDYYEYYKKKFEIAKEVGPKRIAELGVRYGYSGYSFLLGSNNNVEFFDGYDIIDGNGGAKELDALKYAEKLLKLLTPNVTIYNINTQHIKQLNRSYDFIHVDADHTYTGALHDLEISWQALESCGNILIDDYDYIASVYKAIEDFSEIHKNEMISWKYWRGFRGEVLITKQ